MDKEFKFDNSSYQLSSEELKRIQRLAQMLINEEMSKNARRLIGESLMNIIGNAVGK